MNTQILHNTQRRCNKKYMDYAAQIKYNGNIIATIQENEEVELDCTGTVMGDNIEVTVEAPPSNVFNDNSWNTIKSAVNAGTAASYWKVGDRKAVTLNGTVGKKTFSNTTTYCYILGFDHNKSVESNNAHALHIGFGASALSGGAYIAYCDSQYGHSVSRTGYFSMNTSDNNSGGWNSCQMKSTICPAFKNALPSDLKNNIRAVTKWQNNGNSTTG